MSIQEIIEESLSSPPVNESTTCEWVIYPLLLELGYTRREMVSRIADSNGQFPDYTLLPDSGHTWYLEAKDWNTALHDRYAQQSLNYANQNGRRWVVLSNGQVWRLYDNDIRGTASEKLVAEADVRDMDDASAFLQAVSKQSILGNGLDRYAANVRLASELRAQLRDPNSESVKALWGVLKKQSGLSRISRRSICEYFSTDVTAPERSDTGESPTIEDTTGSTSLISVQPLGSQHLSLDEVVRNAEQVATGRKPVSIILPDGSECEARNWAELAKILVQWLVRQGQRVPIPFQGTERGKRYFLNSEPIHPDRSPMHSIKEIKAPAGTLYMHTQRSASNLISRMADVCNSCGIPLTTIHIKIAK